MESRAENSDDHAEDEAGKRGRQRGGIIKSSSPYSRRISGAGPSLESFRLDVHGAVKEADFKRLAQQAQPMEKLEY